MNQEIFACIVVASNFRPQRRVERYVDFLMHFTNDTILGKMPYPVTLLREND